jgi:protein CMS1
MATTEKKPVKRPAPDAGGSGVTTNKKKRKRLHQQEHAEADLDTEAGLNRAFERMDSQLLADHIAQKTTRFATDLSSVELSDLYISGEEMPRAKVEEHWIYLC